MYYEWLVVWLVDELQGIGCMNNWLSQCDFFIDCDWLNVIDCFIDWFVDCYCDWWNMIEWLIDWMITEMIDWLSDGMMRIK